MKKITTLVLTTVFFICLATNCDSNDEINLKQEEIIKLNKTELVISQNQTWNLTYMSGGFLGIDQNYSSDIIKWTFDANNSILIITNDDPRNSNYYGLKEGRYQYQIHKLKDETYLFIENSEYGAFILDKNSLLINQNKTITGTISDGFIYKFIK